MNRSFSCGLEAALSLIGAKWKLLVLFHLMQGTRRFGELRRLVGDVSEKVLIEQLKQMVADGIVERNDFQTVPPRVEYAMTDFGRSLAAAMVPLCEWGTANITHITGIAELRAAQAPRLAPSNKVVDVESDTIAIKKIASDALI